MNKSNSKFRLFKSNPSMLQNAGKKGMLAKAAQQTKPISLKYIPSLEEEPDDKS